MSSAATELAGPLSSGEHHAPGPPRHRRHAVETRLERWILWLLAAVELCVVFVAADRSYFWFDDVKWQVARAHGFPGYGFITQPVNDHFVPGWLFTQGIVPYVFGSHYWAQALLLAVFATSISALSWHLGKEVGVREPLLLVLVALLTLGGMTREAVSWWSSALHTLPPAAALLGVVLAFLRARRRRSWSLAVLGGILLFVASCFIELSLIWVLLIPLLDLLVLQHDRSAAARLRGLWSHARFHAALLLSGVLYLAWWLVSTPWPRQSHLGPFAFAQFAWNSWFYGFWPMVTDVRGSGYLPLRPLPGWQLSLLVVVQVIVVTAGAWALWRRPRSRGILCWFVVAFLLTQYALSTGRDQSLIQGAVASRYQFPCLVALTIVLFVLTGSPDLEARAAPPNLRRGPLRRADVALVIASIALGAVLFSLPVPSVPVLTRIAASQRVGFASLAALPPGTTVLNVQAPWDGSALMYNTPASWMSIVATKPGVHTTLVGEGPMVAPTREGRFAHVNGPSLKATEPTCGVTGSTLPIAESIHLSFERQDAEAIVVRVSALAPATLLAQVQLRGKAGRLGPWAPASGLPQTISVHRGLETVWFPIATRDHGTLHGARIVVVEGGPICVQASGTGPVSSAAAGGSR